MRGTSLAADPTPPADARRTRPPLRIQSLLLLAVVVASGAVRLRQCLEAPVNTGDVARHLLYGLIVAERGPAWAGTPLAAIDPSYAGVSWSNLPYNYPVLALLFFVAIASLWPTILAAKLALTVVEGVNAFLLTRLTGSRWLGALYWAYPASIWWVSREGQFEPLQSLFALAGLVVLRRSPVTACVLLGLAIQTKLTAGLLLPLFLLSAARHGSSSFWKAGAGLATSFLPTLASLAFYPSVQQLLRFSTPLRYNPYYWNPLDRPIFLWNPPWLVGFDEIASYGLVIVLAIAAARTRSDRLAYLAPLAFAVVLKLHGNVQFWYWLAMPLFVVPIPDRRLRHALLLTLPLLDVYSASQLAVGPWGYRTGSYFVPPAAASSPLPAP
jgi:hypothetical protein